MKNYLNFNEVDEKVTYIKKFKINGDKIKVIFANGGKNVVPNTKENKEKIEKKLENQLKIGNNNGIYRIFEIFAFGLAFIVTLGTVGDKISKIVLNNGLSGILNNLIWIIPSVGVLTFLGAEIKRSVEILVDHEKSEEFVKNKELLKEITAKNKGYLLDGVSSKAMKTFVNDGPSINDVEKKFKLKDFKTIVNNKKREEEIDLDYGEKQLKKTIK